MISRTYEALLLDLDGTLLNGADRPLPEVVLALQAAQAKGVHVMVVTGRSKIATLPLLDELGLDSPAVIFNGAAVYCPAEGRLIQERTLSTRTLERLYAFGRDSGDMTVLMTSDAKLGLRPRDEREQRSLDGLAGVRYVEREALRADHVIRVTFLSDRPSSSADYARQIEQAVGLPLYTTHFPLSVLPRHRASSMQAVDVQPPCRGKAEALRFLEERYGIPPEQVVAVGDATNDAPLIEACGLGVAMGNSMEELKQVADRVIGHHDTPALADLVHELFL